MKHFIIALVASAAFGLTPVFAEEASGPERMGEGTVDAVTSPGKIVEGLQEETEKRGPVVGTVTGAVKGGAEAAGQAVKGAANVGVGAVETVLSPITGSDD